jgi:RNA polymerase sigma-70 factor, ECF subfamily
MVSPAEVATSQEPLSDEEVVARVLAGETAMFEIVMRRHNQRLYRVARAILRNDGEAEDVMQDAYVRAYEHLDQFAGKAKFSTWLTRIAVHEALARQRRGNRYQELEPMSEREGDPMDRFASLAPDPEQQASNSEVRRLLEDAVEKLPDAYRTIFILRKSLYARAGMERKEAFNFHAVRCDRVVKNVFERIQQQALKTEGSAAKTQ